MSQKLKKADKLKKLYKIETDIEIAKFDIDIDKKVLTTHSSQIYQLKK